MLEITRGADIISTYNKTPDSYRKWCKACGGHLFTEHPGIHVHYAETRLPKIHDLPKETGGSGMSVPDQLVGQAALKRRNAMRVLRLALAGKSLTSRCRTG